MPIIQCMPTSTDHPSHETRKRATLPDAPITTNSRPWIIDRPTDTGPRCLAVMYHYVHDVEPLTSHGLHGLTSREFRGQLQALLQDMEPIEWSMLYAAMEGRTQLPKRCFLLTFDDGLADHRDYVLPVLQDLGLHGTFFVSGAPLTAQGMLSAHAVHLLLAALGHDGFRRSFLEAWRQQTSGQDPLKLIDKQRAEAAYYYEPKEVAHLKYLITYGLPIDARNETIQQLFADHVGSSTRWSRQWYLGWDDLVNMQSLGHTIGGHGFHHESYDRLNETERRTDLKRIHDMLREGLGSDLRPFSYPFGGFSADIASDCRNAGFVHAFTTVKGWATANAKTMQIPRIDTIDVDIALQEERLCQQA